MRQTIYILLILIPLQTFGQSKVDTLFVGNNKTVLKKVKPFHTMFQDGPVQLPTEYAEIDNRIQFKFKDWNDSSYTIKYEDQDIYGGQTTFVKVDQCKDTTHDFTYTMSHFVDTIIVDAESLGKVQVFIKSEGHKIFFCAARIEELKNGIMQEYSNTFAPRGYILNYYDSPETNPEEIEARKSTTYILTDLYYVKGQTTYYLDRQYVIIAK
jgi:hypothetical protein